MKCNPSCWTLVFAGFVVIFTVPYCSAESPQAADAYFSRAVGDIRSVKGTLKHNGVAVRNSEFEELTVGIDTCDGNPCIRYSRTIRILPPEEESSRSIILLQMNTNVESCTWGVEVPAKKRIRLGCRYKDLMAPIRQDAEWTFRDDYQPLFYQLESSEELEFKNVIENVGTTRKVGGSVFKDCVLVSRTASFTPEQTIDCRDGTRSQVLTSIAIENWYCPAVGSVSETVKETHRKLGTPSIVCYEAMSESETYEFQSGAKKDRVER